MLFFLTSLSFDDVIAANTARDYQCSLGVYEGDIDRWKRIQTEVTICIGKVSTKVACLYDSS